MNNQLSMIDRERYIADLIYSPKDLTIQAIIAGPISYWELHITLGGMTYGKDYY